MVFKHPIKAIEIFEKICTDIALELSGNNNWKRDQAVIFIFFKFILENKGHYNYINHYI
jgi:hypothetical protein